MKLAPNCMRSLNGVSPKYAGYTGYLHGVLTALTEMGCLRGVGTAVVNSLYIATIHLLLWVP